MKQRIEGRIWLFGDNLDTDQLAPGKALTLPWEQRRPRLFPKRPKLVEQLVPGDIIVAGKNFGCGSSREQAVENLQGLGVACVIAESYGRIFFRNAIAHAMPAISCPGISGICAEGDRVRFDWGTFEVNNLTNGNTLSAQPFSDDMIDIIRSGGLLNRMMQIR